MIDKQRLEQIIERMEQMTSEQLAMTLGLALGLSANQKIAAGK